MSTTQSPCVFCHCKGARVAWKVKDIYEVTRYLCQCHTCGTWFYDPLPTAGELEHAYDNSYYGESQTKFRWWMVERTIEFFRAQRARDVHRIMGGKGRILDVGCGNGRFLHNINVLGGVEVYGTELPGNSAERAKHFKEINLFIGSFANTSFPSSYFDAITLFHVFEHLPQPANAIRKIYTALKPDGTLILSFPNIRSMQAQRLKQHWLHLDPLRHLFFPDPIRFASWMTTQGFSLVHTTYFSPEQNPVGMVQGILNAMSSKRDVLFERMKGNLRYAPEYGALNIFLQKVFFICTMPWFMLGDVFESLAKSGATVQLTFKKIQSNL